MELDLMRMVATLINFGILIGIFILIIKFIKWLKNIGKRIEKIEKNLNTISERLKIKLD